jgi:hypothetical protein
MALSVLFIDKFIESKRLVARALIDSENTILSLANPCITASEAKRLVRYGLTSISFYSHRRHEAISLYIFSIPIGAVDYSISPHTV